MSVHRIFTTVNHWVCGGKIGKTGTMLMPGIANSSRSTNSVWPDCWFTEYISQDIVQVSLICFPMKDYH